MEIDSYIVPAKEAILSNDGYMKQPGNQPLEDRALKAAAHFMGKELLPLLGVKKAVTSFYYQVEVETYVICSSQVKKIKEELIQGINKYRVQVIRLKDRNADKTIESLEKNKGGFEYDSIRTDADAGWNRKGNTKRRRQSKLFKPASCKS